ncbi:hypothetical protein JAO76_01115 [Pontibacter sp. BT310]|jgi:hypothetical protein|uniref:DUF4251 domain-containing protein n=1 Tax=Pontibacter populi TaxID=890055 RepID=A0ABS6X6L2_9BACT|nr:MULTISPECIES: hypothetical protein [Pontibacter]MBJ6116770.1 hypothetical protein [Pontibacter sp. BT310]MBR0569192.1 hypothetical protein [Microvirga sp. STS03]MBW3363623.1 hypothetical protein [Pontibacter populi]
MFTLLCNSFNYRYALRVRLLALLFFVHSVAVACTSEPPSEESTSPVSRETIDTAAVRAPRRAPATIDFLGNPFIANVVQSNSLSAYFDKIQDDFSVDADAIENMHRPNITDTIYTIRFGNSMLELYAPTQSGKLLLQVADIRNSTIKLRNNLRVGMPQEELTGKLKAQNIQLQQSPDKIIASTKDGAPIHLYFFLKNGKVSRIFYEGYVD